MEARNKVVHGRIDFSEKELTEYTRSAAYIHGYLRPIVAEIRYFQSIFAGTKFSDVDLWPKKPKSDSK